MAKNLLRMYGGSGYVNMPYNHCTGVRIDVSSKITTIAPYKQVSSWNRLMLRSLQH